MSTDNTQLPQATKPQSDPRLANAKKLKHSDRQTLINLVLALSACLIIVLIIVMASPSQHKPMTRTVDVSSSLTAAQQSTSMQLVNPLQSGWTANDALWTPASNTSVASWYVSMITNNHRFMGMTQTDKPNPTWLSGLLNAQTQTSTITISGTRIDVYDHRGSADDKTKQYALVVPLSDSTVVLYGSTTPAVFKQVAATILREGKTS